MKNLLTAIIITAMTISLFGCEGDLPREETSLVTEGTSAVSEVTTVPEITVGTIPPEIEGTASETTKKKLESVSMKKHREFEWSYCGEIESYFRMKEAYADNPEKGIVSNYGGSSNIGYEPDMGINVITFTRPIDGGILNGEINIGSEMQTVSDTFGNADVCYDNGHIYYFNGFCLMFYGEETVQYIAVAAMPQLPEEYNTIPFTMTEADYEVYAETAYELSKKFPIQSVQFFSSFASDFMFFPNGVTVMQESTGMRLCRNYYADWDMFSETGYLSISDNETLLDGFIDFCVMYNSSGWLDNPSGTLSIFPKENSYKYNSSIVIKNNEDGSIRTFNSNSLLSGINKSDWLTDDIWVCSTHSDALYTADYVTVYNCKTDARLEYYSALGYEPNENNDGIILHYSDNTKHISTKEIIEQLDERM